MSQTFGQREAFRNARETRLVSGSRHCGGSDLSQTSSNSLKMSSGINVQKNKGSIDFPELDQHGRDAESMRAIRGIGTAFIVGVCVFTILAIVGYFLWVYRA